MSQCFERIPECFVAADSKPVQNHRLLGSYSCEPLFSLEIDSYAIYCTVFYSACTAFNSLSTALALAHFLVLRLFLSHVSPGDSPAPARWTCHFWTFQNTLPLSPMKEAIRRSKRADLVFNIFCCWQTSETSHRRDCWESSSCRCNCNCCGRASPPFQGMWSHEYESLCWSGQHLELTFSRIMSLELSLNCSSL